MRTAQSGQQRQQLPIEHLKEGKDHASGPYKQPRPAREFTIGTLIGKGKLCNTNNPSTIN